MKVMTGILRLLSIASRALLIYVFAYFAKPFDVATFSLINAYAGLFVIANGFDLTRAAQRDIKINFEVIRAEVVLKNIFSFFALYYILFFFLTLVCAAILDFNISLVVFFLFLVLFEHLSQEASRLLVVSNRQFDAGASLFIRSFFPLVFLIVGRFFELSLTLNFLLATLCFWSFISFIFTWRRLLNVYSITMGYFLRLKVFSFKYILSCFSYSLFFFISTVVAKMLFALDKSLIDEFVGAEMLATYALVLGVGMVSAPLVDILFGSYSLPQLFDAIDHNRNELRRIFKKYFSQVIVFLIIYYIFSLMMVSYLFPVFFPAYEFQSMEFFSVVLLLPVIFSMSIIPSQVLIVSSQSKILAVSSIVSIFACLSLSAIMRDMSLGIVYAFLLGILILCVIRFYFAAREVLRGF